MNPGKHPGSKPGHPGKSRSGSPIGYAQPVNAQGGPGPASTDGAQIRAAVLFAASDQGGGYPGGLCCPFCGPLPAFRFQYLPNGRGLSGALYGPGKGPPDIIPEPYNQDTGPELRDPKIGGLDKPEGYAIAQGLQAGKYRRPVSVEAAIQ